MDSRQRRHREEDSALHQRERRAAERLAEHNRRARDRCDQNALQKTLASIVNRRGGRENRREQQHQDDHAGVKVLHVVESGRHPARLERRLQAGAEQQPEHQRRRNRAHHANRLADEPHDLAIPERFGLKKNLSHSLLSSIPSAPYSRRTDARSDARRRLRELACRMKPIRSRRRMRRSNRGPTHARATFRYESRRQPAGS